MRSPVDTGGAPTNSETVVELVDVGLEYPGPLAVKALDAITLSVPRGSFVSIIGPSGCGKSTLLRIVAGILRPTAGMVQVEGASAAAAQEAHRFGFVFQDPVLLPWRSVQDNVELLSELVGQPAAERRSRSSQLLALVGLAGREHLRPAQLSGGMRQRVAIARALAIDPSILLMDEPFSALDEFQREVLNGELLRIWTEQSNSVMFITHNIEEAVFLSDAVYVMSAGPGRILERVDIDLPRPRESAIRLSQGFLELRSRLREVLVH
ncbi:MAG: ABC transporter ATP-binding protein [Acidimicrobiales bacterium]